MKKIAATFLFLFLTGTAFGFQVTIDGTYNSKPWPNDRPNVITGGVDSKGNNVWEGELKSDYKGKVYTYKGTLTGNLESGTVKGNFEMAGYKRIFTFEAQASGGTLTGNIKEETKGRTGNVGDLNIKLSGIPKGGENPEMLADVISGLTEVDKEKILELFKSNATKDNIISSAAAASVSKGDFDELYKKKKRINTNYEFLKELKLDKDAAKEVNDLIKKIKEGIEKEKKKKK